MNKGNGHLTKKHFDSGNVNSKSSITSLPERQEPMVQKNTKHRYMMVSNVVIPLLVYFVAGNDRNSNGGNGNISSAYYSDVCCLFRASGSVGEVYFTPSHDGHAELYQLSTSLNM